MKNKKEIPNCAICKWLEKRTIMLNIHTNCQAQGFQSLYHIYNNKLCQKLYEKKEKSDENIK